MLMVFLSALCYVFLERDAPGATDEQYLAAIQDRIKTELRISSDELMQVTDRVKETKDFTFSNLSFPTRYPYFVFQDGKILYWSDQIFVPDYESIANVAHPRLVNFDQGNYIVSRQKVVKNGHRYDIYSLVMVYRHYNNTNTYLQSGYNPTLFPIEPKAISMQKAKSYQNIYDNSPVFLFSVTPPHIQAYRNHTTPVNTVILATLGVLFLGLYVIRLMIRFGRKRQFESGFFVLLAYLLILRGVMLYFGVPFLFIDTDLFNPKFYASSVIAPSLSDMLLNALAVAVLGLYMIAHYYRTRTFRFLIRQHDWVKLLVSVSAVIASYVVFYLCYTELNNIYEKSQYMLDISLSIHFSHLKIACLLVFVSISLIYFLALHLLTSLFIRFNNDLRQGWLAFLVGTVLSAVLYYAVGVIAELVWVLNGVYFIFLYLTRFPRILYTFRYQTSIYLFFAAFICALTTAYVVYRQEIKKDVAQKKDFGARLLAENDVLGEFLLDKARGAIAGDNKIRKAFRRDSILGSARIQHRVKSTYLEKYFEKYDVEVLSFDADGNPLEHRPNAVDYEEYDARYRTDRYKTQYNGLYFVNEVGNNIIKQYIGFIDIYGQDPDSTLIGRLVLDLKLRNETPKNVYLELLVDKKLIQSPESQDYSYVIYGGSPKSIMYSTGSYNYDRKMPQWMLERPELYDEGMTLNGYKHVGLQGKNGRTIVTSSLEFPVSSILSNFSFLFLILVLTVIVAIMTYAIRYQISHFSVNYSTRIQILLNIAFFLPLLLVMVIILGVITSNYVSNQETAFISNTRNIASNFLSYLDEYQQGKRSLESAQEELKKIARDVDTDINVFDTTGVLFTSTRPLMYESGHLSKRINPLAYIHLIENKEKQVLLSESLGSKDYRTAYAGIKSYNGRLLGVLSVPYFYAQPELDEQVSEVVASTLNVFMILFIVFLILSYVASNSLTGPLRLITQKIRRTNLDKLNEPLDWKSDDEIGLLVGEYNRMLVKLEESKQALSVSEKQSAWREMAKQIAHEIKNPLTPMKLTLQHLQRTMPVGEEDSRARRIIKNAFESLLEQIDNISEVAASFSELAKMPLPKNEMFEITSVLNKAADLYADDERNNIYKDIMQGPIMVIGDRQMTGRIITNLIINGIQSVPQGRKPSIDLKLFTTEEEVQIEIHDNGTGIPESIRAKVFLPNFSTKKDGSGLGLAIAKRGIEHVGGSIWFETTEDVGTSFFVTLPLAQRANGTSGSLSKHPEGVIRR